MEACSGIRNTRQAELSSLLARYAPEKVTILRAASTHTLFRLTCQPRSYILKWCNDLSDCLEPRIYDLLDRYWVPTLDVHARTDRALVLEDLQTSPAWRLADPSDTSLAATGEALAEWYRDLHRAGQPLRAIVFDYNSFATGIVYSDWRNVMAALKGAAREAFEAGYGPVAAEERCLDQPLATLYGLVIASQRSKIPAWAGQLVDKVINGVA